MVEEYTGKWTSLADLLDFLETREESGILHANIVKPSYGVEISSYLGVNTLHLTWNAYKSSYKLKKENFRQALKEFWQHPKYFTVGLEIELKKDEEYEFRVKKYYLTSLIKKIDKNLKEVEHEIPLPPAGYESVFDQLASYLGARSFKRTFIPTPDNLTNAFFYARERNLKPSLRLCLEETRSPDEFLGKINDDYEYYEIRGYREQTNKLEKIFTKLTGFKLKDAELTLTVRRQPRKKEQVSVGIQSDPAYYVETQKYCTKTE